MNQIANERVHLVTLDPGEVFWGGRYHSLVPLASEVYGAEKSRGYYSVAVVKKESSSYLQTLVDLYGKKVCFPGVGKMAGWVLPMTLLMDAKVLAIKDCNNMVKNAATFFNNSCAPNALIDKHNPTGDNPHSMCSLCKEGCSGSDPYANYDGAIRCLAEVGEVAFVKHSSIDMMDKYLVGTKSPNGAQYSKRDFDLLCPDGRRGPLDSYRTCNWGFVPADSVVGLSSLPQEKRQKIQAFLLQNAQIFGNAFSPRPQLPHVGRTPATTSPFANSPFNTNTRFNSRLNHSFDGVNNPAFVDQTNPVDQSTQFVLFGDYRQGKRKPAHMLPVGFSSQQNLLFSDDTTSLEVIPDNRQTFSGYLGSFTQYFDKLRSCSVPMARLCIVSEKELEKCNKMRTAFRAQMLKPELTCVPAHDTIECMENIRSGLADLTMLDAGDVYRAGLVYNLMPILSEKYNLNDSSYYVVAIARQSDKETDLLYLRGKRSCHTGFGEASGWIIPVSFLLANSRMRPYGPCQSGKAASSYFEKSCVPGALSKRFSASNWDFGNLCDLCHGQSYSFCARDPSEPFYGTTGALRCLVEGDGQIAFTRHMAILENAGKNPSFWSRNVIPEDFELLCRDGSRAKHNQYASCNLGRVAADAMVTHANRPKEDVEAYINLFLLAQQFYGSKYSEDFTLKMFVSEAGYPDLIFSDSSSQLVPVPENERHYRRYLGHEFLKAVSIVDCTSSAFAAKHFVPFTSHLIIVLLTFSVLSFNLRP